jgi:ketosteroid isomerase-like protein
MSVDMTVGDAERARREAMIAADVGVLDGLFADDLQWVHGTARVETKAGLLEAIRTGSTRYLSIDVADEQSRRFGEVVLLSGVVMMKLEIGGEDRDVRSRFTMVWHRTGSGWQLVNWQSTPVRSAT